MTLLLLDGAGLWFRAYHAIPHSIVARDGAPVNAVRGFTDMVASLITRYRPYRLVVCLDLDWRPRFRVDAIASYKAHRLDTSPSATSGAEAIPAPLSGQVGIILELLDAAGIATAGAAGLEADDVIGTLAERERDDDVIVVSGDRDLLQLVSDEPERPPVRVLYIGRGSARAQLYGPTEVSARYAIPSGNAGAVYADLAILRGDPSDGLPGVGGIGEKTASTLLQRYGSLAALRAAVDDPASDVPVRLRAKLSAAREYLDAAGVVVHVVRDAAVSVSTNDTLPRMPADPARLDRLARAHDVTNPVARLITAMTGDPSATGVQPG